MDKGFYVITGTSRGIGETLSQNLVENGNTVLGVSRSRSDKLNYEKYHHLFLDLSEFTGIEKIVQSTNELFSKGSYDFLCLINNAAVLEPINPIEKCKAGEIETHIKVGLITPMILTSEFIKTFSDLDIRKKVIFISSGAGIKAMPDLSIYCSSKAGINMFAQSIGREQKNKKFGFEILSVNPGMVETSMQKIIRSKTKNEFEMVGLFTEAFEKGKVQENDNVIEKIKVMIKNKYTNGQFINCSEV
jgi:benzil reductase ((S)-benzoin forming)